jgi:gliding motility-associated-like protein
MNPTLLSAIILLASAAGLQAAIKPIITKNPDNSTFAENVQGRFYVNASSPDGGYLTYQWYRSALFSGQQYNPDVIKSGATALPEGKASILTTTTPDVTATAYYCYYWVEVTNHSAGEEASAESSIAEAKIANRTLPDHITNSDFSTVYAPIGASAFEWSNAGKSVDGWYTIVAQERLPNWKTTDYNVKNSNVTNFGNVSQSFQVFCLNKKPFGYKANSLADMVAEPSNPTSINTNPATANAQADQPHLVAYANHGDNGGNTGNFGAIELANAYPSSVYQEIATAPGKIYEWSIDHSARRHDSTDVMAVVIGAAVNEKADLGSDQELWENDGVDGLHYPYGASYNDNPAATPTYFYKIIAALASSKGKTPEGLMDYVGQAFTQEYNGHVYYVYVIATGTVWTTYSGVYTIPAGQGATVFSFVGLYPAVSSGNVLDNIVFSSGRPIDSEQNVSYTSAGETQLSAATAPGFAYGIVEVVGSTPVPLANPQTYYDPDGQGSTAEAAIIADASGWYKSSSFSAAGVIAFKNLTAGKTYRIVGIPEGAINLELGVNKTPGDVLDEGYYKDTRMVPDGAGDVWSLEAGVEVEGAKAWVAVANARGDVEYALLDSAEYAQALAGNAVTVAHGWTTNGSGRVTFGDLKPGTVYYFVSRPAGYGGYKEAAAAAIEVETPTAAEGRNPNLPLVMGGVGSKLPVKFDGSRPLFEISSSNKAWLWCDYDLDVGNKLVRLEVKIEAEPDTVDRSGYIVVTTEKANTSPQEYCYDTIYVLQPHFRCVPPKQDNTGTDFFVAFLENSSSSDTELYLYATTDHKSAKVTVSRNDNNEVVGTDDGLEQNHVEEIYKASGSHAALCSSNPAYSCAYQTAALRSLRVSADSAISLYAYNAQSTTSESSYIIPTAALGDEYFTTSYSGDELRPEEELLLIATEPHTLVTITPSDGTFGRNDGVDAKPAGAPFTVYLENVGQTYMVRSRGLLDSEGLYVAPGLSGTHIKASKPIAVFGGNKCASVGEGCTGSCDHLFEQMLPLRAWGKRYAFAETNLPSNIYRIVAAYDNTKVAITSRDTTETLTLQRGKYVSRRQVKATSSYTYIEASQPVQVALLAESNDCLAPPGSTNGDPFLLILGPVDRGVFDATFTPIKLINPNHNPTHHITVIVETLYKDSTKLMAVSPNGIVLDNSLTFYDMPNTPYSYGSPTSSLTYQAERNYHLSNPYGFTAYAYGYGYYESYGYLIGAQFGEKLEEKGSSSLGDLTLCVGSSGSLPICIGGGTTCLDTAGSTPEQKEEKKKQRYYWYNNLSDWGNDNPLDSAPLINTEVAGVYTCFASQWGVCGVLYPHRVTVEVVALTEITGFRDTIMVCLSSPSTGDYGAKPVGGTYTYATGTTSTPFDHTKVAPGYYTVTYTYQNQQTGCTSTAKAVIHVETLDRGPRLDVVTDVGVGDVSFCRGQEMMLTVRNAAGRTFQWYHQRPGGTRDSIHGATANTYRVRPSASVYAGGTYSVDVLNANGCRAEVDTTVTIYEPPAKPHIATYSSTAICAGSSYTLYDSAEVFSIGESRYQWYKTSSDPANKIPGETGYKYTVNSETITGARRFVLGAVTPVPGKDTTLFGCWSYDTLDMMIYKPANTPSITPSGAKQQICEGDSLTLRASALSSEGYTYRWYSINPDESVKELSLSGQLRVAAGAYYARSISQQGCPSIAVSGTVSVATRDKPGTPDVSAGPTVCKGGVVAIAATAIEPKDVDSLWYRWYIVGSSGAYTEIAGATDSSYGVTESGSYAARATAAYGSLQCSSPYSDKKNVSLWPLPLSPEVTGATDVCIGGSNVRLVATPRQGSAPVDKYQWYKDGSQLLECTDSVMEIEQSEGEATYAVKAINSATSCVSLPSNSTKVTVYNPTVSIGGANQRDTCFGNAITLLATTNAGSGSSYQWYEDDTELPEKGTTSYQVRSVDPLSVKTASYSLRVTNRFGCTSERSNVIKTTIYAASNAPEVSVSPAGVCEGDTVTLSATRPSTGTYEWFFERDGKLQPVANTFTDSSCTILHAKTSDNGWYAVRITTNDGCVSKEGRGKVEVYSLPGNPVIDPDARHICTGDSVRIRAYSSTGHTYHQHRWYFDGGNGKNELPSLSGGEIYVRLAGDYTVQGMSEKGCWSAESDSANISVHQRPESPAISPAENPVSVCVRSATFLTASSKNSTSYQWYAYGTFGYEALSGATGSSCEVAQSGRYAARAYIQYASVQCSSESLSLPKEVQLFNVPFTPRIEGAATACAGDTVTLTAVSEPGDPTTVASYVWYKNGLKLNLVAGATCPVTQVEDARYTVVAISDKSCASDASGSKEVRIRKPTVSIAEGERAVCFGGTVMLEAQTNTGAASYYEWYDVSDPKHPQEISDVSGAIYVARGEAGDSLKGKTTSYYAYVIDEQGCRSSLPSETVTVNIWGLPPTPTVTAPAPQCEGITVTLEASPTGAGTYQWLFETNGAFEPIGVASSETHYRIANAHTSDAGRYGVRVTNQRGCTSLSGSVQVGVYALPPSPLITPGEATHLLCFGDSVALTAYTFGSSAGRSYEWYFDNGVSRAPLSSTAGRVFASLPGVYSVWSRSEQGCLSASAGEASVETYGRPSAPFISPDGRVSVCANGSTTISGFAAGATSYQWYAVDTATAAYTLLSGRTGSDYEVGSSGHYAVRADIRYSDRLTCSALSPVKEVELLQTPLPPTVATVEKTPTGGEKTSGCDGDVLTLIASLPGNPEGTSYKWYKKSSGEDDFRETSSSSATCTVTQVESAEYRVSAVSSRGCPSEPSAAKEVVIRRRPTVSIADLTEAERNPCGGTVTLLAVVSPAAGGGSYEWYENGAYMEKASTSSIYVVQGAANPLDGRAAACYLYVTDRYGCRSATSSNTVEVNIRELPPNPAVTVATLTPNGVCEGSDATLTVSPSGAGTCKWFKRSGSRFDSIAFTSDVTLRVLSAKAADAGQYAVEIVNTYGCKSAVRGEAELNVLGLPTVRIRETFACEDWTEFDFAEPAGGAFVGWPNDKFIPADVHQGEATVTYAYTGPNGCSNRDTKTITIVSLPNTPIVTAEGSTAVCEDSILVSLKANVAVTPGDEDRVSFTYQWYREGAALPNEAAPSYVATKAGAYAVRVCNQRTATFAGCWAASPSDPVEVSVKPLPTPPVIAAKAPAICPGGATEIFVQQAEKGSFQWYKGDSKSMQEILNEITASCSAGEVGQYAVKLFGENECWSPMSNLITLGEYPLPEKPEILPSQALLYAGLDYTMTVRTPVAGERYGWYKNNLATDVAGVTYPIHALDGGDTGRYTVRAVNEHECYTWSEPYLLVWADAQLFIPNIFTPNGDGVNDCFQIIGLEDFVENKLEIRSKRGNVVFSQKNYHNSWCGDGASDVYYYLLELKREDGTKSVLRGYVHVKP